MEPDRNRPVSMVSPAAAADQADHTSSTILQHVSSSSEPTRMTAFLPTALLDASMTVARQCTLKKVASF